MNNGQSVLSQLLSLVHREALNRIVRQYEPNSNVRNFGYRQQFACMVFAQLTWRDGLRSIQDCLNARQEQLYHLGFSKPVSKSTLADANETRNWRIWQDVALGLIRKARKLYGQEEFSDEVDHVVYALDSSTVDLSLSLFPWAKFRSQKGGIKIHTQLDLKHSIPIFIEITEARMSDVKWLDNLTFESNAIYVFDRGYIDFTRFQNITKSGAYFITRGKSNTRFTRIKSINSQFGKGISSDHIGHWENASARKKYPGKVRRIRAWDSEAAKYVIFFTNQLELQPDIITSLYKHRWKIELFFKWIKQNLRIKHFYGTSSNAVKTQIWTAISTYVMVAIVYKKHNLPGDLHRILQVLSVYPFERITLYELLMKSSSDSINENKNQQLTFNDL